MILLLPAIFAAAIGGCDRSPAPASPVATTRTSGPPTTTTSAAPTSRGATAASLSPAATEILVGLGLADRLVAVSNYDRPQPETTNLPRVGDYQSTDWERLAALRPSVMITQFGPGRTSAGLVRQAARLNIQLLNVSITRLDDIFAAMTTLADALGESNRGRAAVQTLHAQLGAIAARSAGRKVPALVIVSDDARGAAGRDNYLDDVLAIAGGENVIAAGASPYPQIDREMLLQLDPEVIFQLLPGASPQVREAAARVWQAMPQLRAVKTNRVVVITEPWCLSPSQHVVDLAGIFAAALAQVRSGEAHPVGATPASPASVPLATQGDAGVARTGEAASSTGGARP